ncbi:hypothetical protein QMK19_39745 [Streptomyces sp. H10-C2]|uniref:hypothetical protein n=1 Tax=unclassified Streptomyces TaxID=2593676 RepID=UPI0024BBC7D3|nr:MULTISPECIES: hypothetical protein [unclassified Streptomyces]MDJ0347347.1 hypothetical protein [Streptomyces sp. PH10-H1]MDJ0375558.1 hypothetical protein [Streptomyces sp. H10-C2]
MAQQASASREPERARPQLIPSDEVGRIAAVRRYDILDTPPDGAFDRVAAMCERSRNSALATIT